MKKNLLFILVILVTATSCRETLCENGIYPFCKENEGTTPITGTYTPKTKKDLGFQNVAFAVGGKGYVGTGMAQWPDTEGGTKQFWSYDPATDKWESVASLPGSERHRAFGFATSSKGYVGAGTDYAWDEKANQNTLRVDLKDFWEYDPANNTWIQKPDLPGGEGSYIGFGIGNVAYVIKETKLWMLSAAGDAWVPKADCPVAVSGGQAFSIGPLGYIIFGGKLLEYNPVLNKWTERATPPYIGSSGFATTTRGYVVGAETWEYNPLNDSWTRKADLPVDKATLPRGYAITPSFGIGDKGYINLEYRASSLGFFEFTPSK